MIDTPFKLTEDEILCSAAATLCLHRLAAAGTTNRRLKEVAEHPQYGYTASATNTPTSTRFLRITDIRAGSVNWDTVPFCSCERPDSYLIQSGDILVARSGSVGKTFLVGDVPEPTVFASYMIRVRAKTGLVPAFLSWCLQSQQFWEQLMRQRRGSAMANINGTMLSELEFPIPSETLQTTIVEFLNHFRRRLQGHPAILVDLPAPLDSVPQAIQRIEELAGRIHEANTLRHLSAEEVQALWAGGAAKLFDRAMEEYPILPLEDLVSIRGGGTPSKSDPFYWDGSIPWITPKDMKRRELNDAIDHISERATQETAAKLIEPGSVLVVVRGMILAHTFPSAVLRVPAAINQDMKALAPNASILPEFLCALFWAHNLRILKLVEKSTHDTRKLETPKLLSIKIPVPPLPEQRRIVAELDALQAEVDALKRLQDETLVELDALLPSILSTAFTGEL
ncbi:MAG: restriction endonuclease subunit S [Bryobacteraceae bacterium]|jgi:type I restriction enzyme S subunit